nr:12156_t:CDS:2 [Entrophospora candida]
MATLDTVRSSSPEFLGLATQFGISSAISLYCLLQFEWNRRRKSMQYLYTPRTRLIKNPSPPVPPGLFSWVKAAYRLDDKFYLTNVGLDALMYIRFLRMAFHFLLFNSLLVGPILLPINYTASASSTEERNNVDIFSVKNIKFDLNRLWAHMICTYIVSISWMYLLYKNYYSYMKLHKEYLLKKVDSGDISVRTVMISRIPEELRSEEELQKYVNGLCIGTVESARMVRHTGKLDRRIERREKALLLLERAHIQLAKNVYRFIKRRKLFGNGFWFKIFSCNKDNDVPALTVESGETREHQRIQSIIEKVDIRKRKHIMDYEDGYGHQLSIWESLSRIPKSSLDKFQPKSGFFSGGKTVYAIDHFIRKFNFLDRSIAGLRSLSVTGLPYKATSTGFVTFRDHISAQMCAQSIICSTPHTCTVKMAPEPRDLLWTSPLIHTLLRNVLPTVLVSIFMAMLPWILMELSKQECFSSYSELENAVLVRYYYFSFFNVIVVFLLGKVFLESIFNILNSPASILETLANTLPQGATFFINYIVFNTCAHGFELVQVVPQIFLHILLTSRFVSTTPRILQRVTHPHSFQFYYYYPNHILILVITITYSTINPLVLPFSVLYFGIALLVFKYQFGYCYVRRYEAGGRFYKSVFRYTTDGLVVFQLTVLGVLWLNKAIAIGTLLMPLLAGTVASKDTDSTMNNESSQKENFSKGDFIVNDKKEEKSISKKQLSSKDEMREKKLSSHSLSNIDEKSVDSINSKKVLLAQSINSSNNSNIDNRKIIVDESYDSDESDIVEINNDSNSNKSNNGGSASKDSKNVIKDDNNNSNDGSANFTGENNNNPTTITLPPKNLPPKNIPPKKIPPNAQRLPSRGNLRCAPHPAHFTHDPSLKLIQDETSQYQTYTHPNLVKALNRKLWLPRNPFKLIDIEDTVELNQALTSSDCRLSTVGYWGDNSEYLAEARVSLYGIHDFPMSPFHHRGGTGTDRRKRTESGDYFISRDVVDGVEEQNDDESSFCPYAPLSPEEEGRVSLQEFVSGELVSGELSSGEEY